VRAIVPGLAFAILLAIGAKAVSHALGGNVSAILCAIVLGFLWGNLARIGNWAQPGVEFAGSSLLQLGIALIGLRLTLALLAGVSLVAVPVVIACVAVALISSIALGRLFNIAPGIRRLLAAGTAICGCTAMITIAPLVRARQQDLGIAIACVVLFGSIAMVSYPWLAHLFFGTDAKAAGMFLGASIQDTSQVVGASLIYGHQFEAPEAVAVAGLTKFMRTLGLLALVPIAAMWMARRGEPETGERPKGLRKSALPGFVIVFMVLVGVRTAGDAWFEGPAWQRALETAQEASELLLLCGMAAVGLGITFTHLREAGWRPVAVAFLAAALTGATTLALLHL
jgi:uncharacterized integral membrane protein (TIGR00698 family)